MELLEAGFAGHAFDPHRHDVYAIGVTEWGVQGFTCRGRHHASTPGRVIVLHPDEAHDGHAAAEGGFGYRMVYVDPALIARALEHRLAGAGALPFAREIVLDDPALAHAIHQAFADFPAAPSELARDQAVLDLADGLLRHDRSLPRRLSGAATARSLDRARTLLDDRFDHPVPSEELEQATGLDRFTLARQFRRRYGTSPYRYRTMRRLQAARRLVIQGEALAEIAPMVGFADQSHLTRHFKAAFGMTPGRLRLLMERR